MPNNSKSDISYICLSDLHLGEEDSLLTNLKTSISETDLTQPSPSIVQLVECLQYLISKNKNGKKPTLILNGDILELALATTNQSAMAFERFIELIMPSPPGKNLFEKIVYIPGNHDHHIWEVARETQYVENYLPNIPTSGDLEVPRHITKNIFSESVSSYFLNGLLKRYNHLKNIDVRVSYPNYGIISGDNKRCIIFHHGHLTESIYQLMSTLKNLIFPGREKPTDVSNIEAENFAWIDFFWSTMGRAGEVGQDVELIYEKMQEPKQFKELLSNLATSLAEKHDIPYVPGDWAESKVLKWGFNKIAKKFTAERTYTDRPLSQDAERALWEYMQGPLQKQILGEMPVIPPDVTFVFGHTHKPFQEDMNFNGYPGWVNIYNSGGWVVDKVEPQPLHGGAAIIIDEDLNATSLRMYNEAADPTEYYVRVEEASHNSQQGNPLHRRIHRLVDSAKNPWKEFSDVVARSIYVRRQNLRARINSR